MKKNFYIVNKDSEILRTITSTSSKKGLSTLFNEVNVNEGFFFQNIHHDNGTHIFREFNNSYIISHGSYSGELKNKEDALVYLLNNISFE